MRKKSKVTKAGHSVSPQNPLSFKRFRFSVRLHNHQLNAISNSEVNRSMWLSDYCVKCGKRGDVVYCSGNECPIAVHQQCIGLTFLHLEDGHFYCTYCSYKRELRETFELREKIVLAQNTMNVFLNVVPGAFDGIDEGINGGEEPDIGGSISEDGTRCNRADDVVERDEVVALPSEIDERDDNCNQEEMIENVGLNANDNNGKDCDKNVKGVGVDPSDEVFKKNLVDDEIHDYFGQDHVIEDIDLNVNEKINECNESVEKDVTMERAEEEDYLSKSSKNPKNLKFASKGRKKVFWTHEEEETLKEGLAKFHVAKKNIPWRKILQFGCHVFHSSRLPNDLKDKWKNMTKGL